MRMYRSDEMVILVDSREQKPLEFSHPFITEVRRCKLDVGDYCCEYKNGTIAHTVFERKSINDLFKTVTIDHARYRSEIERGKESNLKIILIIEGNLSKVKRGIKYSTMVGERIIKTVFTMFIRYGVIPVFCKDRQECADFIIDYYLAYGRNLNI